MKTNKQRQQDLEDLKNSITNMITTEMSKDQIAVIQQVANKVDQIRSNNEELENENLELKNSLIASIKGSASTKPAEDLDEPKEITMEQLIRNLKK